MVLCWFSAHLGQTSAPRAKISRAPPALRQCWNRIWPHDRYTYGLRGLASAARRKYWSACSQQTHGLVATSDLQPTRLAPQQANCTP